MKKFEEYLLEGKVQKRTPNPSEAKSLMMQARDRIADLKSQSLKESNASFRFEDGYEAIREALQAFLSIRGFKPYSHEAVIAFAIKERLISQSDIMASDRYREIRNDINYKGKKVTVNDAKEVIKFADRIIPLLESKLITYVKKGI